MEASLDTNVIIHLYKANHQDLLFKRFKKLKVYSFIRYTEMKNHASMEIIDLFDKGDLGEVYAIALAKVLGCISLVTDDIKEYGPHYSLMRTPESDVIPFAFYELLMLDFLEGIILEEELEKKFQIICDLSQLNMNFSSKCKTFVRRFWTDPYTETEKEWMKSFCAIGNINAKKKIQDLSLYLKKKKL